VTRSGSPVVHGREKVTYVLQLYADDVERGRNQIRSPGGYYRAFVRMVKVGKIALWAEIRAMRRRRMC
jgi:replication initiation protein RepC